ncbi:hypothetical protein KSX_87360 [Ktedonospora formicarum]|uniref:Uncharacterized protein n=1 Tax=Ktedonospora formicarum TaxID=2778364 RepID=A0A8J3IB01_9CHLR|nr:hypothetical protein KSX_87360 [Ktedonospora formicarum]
MNQPNTDRLSSLDNPEQDQPIEIEEQDGLIARVPLIPPERPIRSVKEPGCQSFDVSLTLGINNKLRTVFNVL